MSNYGVRELTWENGQLTVQGLGELMQPNTSAKPIWTESLSGCQTLESVVHHAAQRSKLQSQDGPNQGEKKRPHSDVDLWLGLQEESLGLGQSVSASVSHHTYDARSLSCASYESGRSFKTARTGDKDYVGSGSDTQETEGEERETKGSRRGKAASVHNESERRRRDRINQRMKTLQKLLPNGNKTDKVSILDDVIDHMKQLKAQIQFMSMRPNLPQQMMMMMMQPLQQQQQFQMALLTTMAHMGMNGGNAFVPPPPFTNTDCNNASSSFTMTPPYSQTMTMDLYNKMAAAFYKQQSDQTT